MPQCVLKSLLPAAVSAAVMSSAMIFVAGCGSGVPASLPSAVSGAPAVQPAAVAAGLELGYVWSGSEQTLRPIVGVPGSSQFGAVVAPAGSYLAAAASPVSSSALVEQADGALVAMHLPDGPPLPVLANVSGVLKIRYAPQGLYAIAFGAGGTSIELIAGLPDAPQAKTIPVASVDLLDAVVGDNGQVVAAFGSWSSISVALLNAGRSSAASTLATVARLGGMAMVPGQDAAIIVDGASGASVLAENLSTALAVQPVLSTGVNKAVGVGVSADGHWALVANSGDASVVRLDLTGGAPVKMVCGFQPNQVSPLLGNAVFRVTDLSAAGAAAGGGPTIVAAGGAGSLMGGPVWMVDASPVTPLALFIPGTSMSGGTATASAAVHAAGMVGAAGSVNGGQR